MKAAIVAAQTIILMMYESNVAVGALHCLTARQTHIQPVKSPAIQEKEGLISILQFTADGRFEAAAEDLSFPPIFGFRSHVHQFYFR